MRKVASRFSNFREREHDGTFAGPFGESANGVFVQFNASQNPDGYDEVRINDVSGARGYIAQVHTTLDKGTEYPFKIVDTGTSIAVYLGDLMTPVLSAEATSRAGNRFSIYNRELAGCVSSLDTLSVTAMPQLSLSVRVSQVELCWESISNTIYEVQYRSTLTGNLWRPLLAGIVGDGTRICVSVPITAGEPQRFFQVVAQNGP